MNSHDILAEIDEDLPEHGCNRCGNRFAEKNYLSNGRSVSCAVCAPQVRAVSTVDWKSDLEKWAREYIAKKEKKS